MLQEIRNCPICSNTAIEKYLTLKDYSITKETFHISTCKSCGFKFTNPIPSEEEIGRYYQSEKYISHTNTRKGIINRLYHFVRSISLKQKLKLVNNNSTKKATLLDIGCGTGYFLNTCKEDGWIVDGMEPDPTARKNAEELTGLTIKTNLFQLTIEDNYQVITLWHVLEHVHKLNESIQHIHKLLKKDGTLIIAVPNHESYDSTVYGQHWAAYDVPRHLYHFDKSSMENLLKQHGFQIQTILPMKFDSYYVSMLSDTYKYGKVNYFRAFKTGFLSNSKGNTSKNHSSLIYIAKKTI